MQGLPGRAITGNYLSPYQLTTKFTIKEFFGE